MYDIFEKLIKEKNLTLYKVSKDTGIANTVLYAWKNGKSSLKQDKLVILADYLGVSVAYLMGLDETPPPTYTPVEQAILHDLMNLSEDQKIKVLDFIQFLIFQNLEEKNKKAPQK